jgi:hypothetical protein
MNDRSARYTARRTAIRESVQISRHFIGCYDDREVGLALPDAGDDKPAATELEAVKNASVFSDLSML